MEDYWKAITVIEAREQLLLIQAVSHPHKTTAKQKEAFRSLHQAAYPPNFMPKQRTDMEGLARMLSR